MKTPCGNCADRHIGCHAECEKYLMWAKQRDEARMRQRNDSIADTYAIERGKSIKSAKIRAIARGRQR